MGGAGVCRRITKTKHANEKINFLIPKRDDTKHNDNKRKNQTKTFKFLNKFNCSQITSDSNIVIVKIPQNSSRLSSHHHHHYHHHNNRRSLHSITSLFGCLLLFFTLFLPPTFPGSISTQNILASASILGSYYSGQFTIFLLLNNLSFIIFFPLFVFFFFSLHFF